MIDRETTGEPRQQTDALRLRAYRSSDTERLVSLANNARVSRYLVDTFSYPYTRADADWWITTGAQQHGAITRVIELDGELIGSIGVTPQSGWRSHIAEIGYWLGEPYWGRGFASIALEQMTELAFRQLNFCKLVAPVLAPNIASMKVLEKNAYRLEGILQNEVCKHDQFFDIHAYARLR